MAESRSVRHDDVVCRFFLSSGCRDGNRCPFSHDSTRRTPDSVCRYYLQGTCVYGQNCRYDHIKVNKHNDRNSAGPSRHSANQDIPCHFTRNSRASLFNCLGCNTYTNKASNANDLRTTSANWINAPEFVPRHTKSYADKVKANIVRVQPEKMASAELCQYFMTGECPLDIQCPYVHGDMCELCHTACLHPNDENQRKVHMDQCIKELEQDMDFSFAMQGSVDKICGICMDVVLEKEPMSERRFGILEKCNHVYCLNCIRKWRRSKPNESNEHVSNSLDPVVTRACPECRISSDFVIPSSYFVDSEEEKKKLITEYKKALSQKHCKYFKKGEGTCPFGGACFYLHAKPDGTRIDLPLPVRRRRLNQYGELDYVDGNVLWDYLQHREETVLVNWNPSDFIFELGPDSDDEPSDNSDSFLQSE